MEGMEGWKDRRGGGRKIVRDCRHAWREEMKQINDFLHSTNGDS